MRRTKRLLTLAATLAALSLSPAYAQSVPFASQAGGTITVGTNNYTVDANGNAQNNGSTMLSGTAIGFWSLEYDNSTLYGQDKWSGKWWKKNGGVFQGPVTAPTVPTWSAGSGSHTITLLAQQDFYEGAAEFTVSVDGTQVGGTFVVSDSAHNTTSQTFNILGSWSAGSHSVLVTMTNDRYDGVTGEDRNLYITGVLVDGVSVNSTVTNINTTHTYTVSIGGSCTTSANATEVTSTGGSICDANHNVWTLTPGTGLQVTKNGTQQGTADVILMYYDSVNDRIYQENNSMAWWYTAANGTVSWVSTTDPRTSANCTGTTWCDDFTSLSAQQHMNSSYTWGYAAPYGPDWDGTTNTGAATAINPQFSATTGTTYSNLYQLDGSGDLLLGIDNAPVGCGTTCRGQPYIEGQLIATTLVSPGSYVEVRAKLPPTPGTNFALWLYNDYSHTGGSYQEIDLLEGVRAADNSWILTSQTIHHDPSPNEGYQDWSRDPTQWHTYGAYWTSSSICLYIDRVQTYCNAQSVAAYTGNMYLYLSSQTSGTWGGDIPSGTTLPVAMTIDYARVYNHKPF